MERIGLKDIVASIGGLRMKSLKVFDYLIGGLMAQILAPALPNAMTPQGGGRILVIRPGGIGDAVFLLPILQRLRAQGAALDVLCEPRNAEIFSSQGYPVFLYTRLGDLWKLSRKAYDAVVDTEQWHYLSAIVAYFMNTRLRIGFASRVLRKKLLNRPVSYEADAYELLNFLSLFEGLLKGQEGLDDINHCLVIPQEVKSWAAQAIPSNSVSVFLGASIVLRRLTRPQWSSVIQGVLAKDLHPVLIGGKDVAAIADDIAREMHNPRILNFAGETTLMQSAALIQRSRTFIGPDSGLMHVACGVGTPVVAVFGPGNLKKWQPKGRQHKVLSEHVPCSPCTRFGYTVPTCHGSYHCIMDLKIDLAHIL